MVRRVDNLEQARMARKHILMPPRLIRHVESMAAEAKVSFGELVRRARWKYDIPADEEDGDVTLGRLAEALIESNKETIAYLDTVNWKLDKTHATLTKQPHDVAG